MHRHDINFHVSGILTNPQEQWDRIKRASMGKNRVAFRKLDVDWKKYNTNDYLFTHDTACCSVETEENGYWITPPCWELVNANGNAWTTPVLLASFKTFIGGENYCFPKGTRVLMSDGTYKNIEDIQIGDSVINAKGEKDTVSNVFCHSYGGKMCRITLFDGAIGNNIIKCTSNHPFLVFCSDELKYVNASELNMESMELINPQKNVRIKFHKEDYELDKEIIVYNFETQNDHSYIAEGVAVHNCEHVQIPALSKGKILDAIARPVVHHSEKYGDAHIYYVDLLIATSRKHANLVERIESGKLRTLSMGCIAEATQCSICGKIIGDNDKNCEHIDKHLGQMVTCQDGKERICAELCGCCDENGNYVENSNRFIECSFVENPAFKGSVVNSFVETEEIKTAREEERDELAKLFDGNLFERLKVADTDSKIALKITKEIGKIDRISGKIIDKI